MFQSRCSFSAGHLTSKPMYSISKLCLQFLLPPALAHRLSYINGSSDFLELACNLAPEHLNPKS